MNGTYCLRALIAMAIACVVAFVADAPLASAQSLQSISVTPANQTIHVGDSLRFNAAGRYANGAVRDLSGNALSGGDDHTCALISNGTIQCWGWNENGQLGNGTLTNSQVPVSVQNISNASAISTGFAHSCAIEQGFIRCWGLNASGQLGNGRLSDSPLPVTVQGIANAQALAAGADHSCALLQDGTVRCWGYNGLGQLGNGAFTDSPTPVAVSGITNAIAIAGGGWDHTCALLATGAVSCWGANDFGQLGSGTVVNSADPVAVTGVNDATAVSVGYDSSCALLGNGTVRCWGGNASGQLGNGSTTDSTVPVLVSGLANAIQVTTGFAHSCALLADRSVRCWGINESGQLGDGTATGSNIPVAVIDVNNAAAIEGGDDHTCVIRTNGSVWCWGYNAIGQLGNGTTSNSPRPVLALGFRVGLLSQGNISVGSGTACAALRSGSASCWGSNSFGELGNGSTTPSSVPTFVIGLTNTTAVAAGNATSCALLATGSVACWGANGTGELGNGTTTASTVPVVVPGITNATAVATTGGTVCALLTGGAIQCWGDNLFGTLGSGSTAFNSLTPVPVSLATGEVATAVSVGWSANACAVLADGTVRCWGSDARGLDQHSNTPVAVLGLSGVLQVSLGSRFACALINDGTVRCWGINNFGQLGVGNTTNWPFPIQVSGITGAVAIAAGADHACAVSADGSVRCWGGQGFGQLGDGATGAFQFSTTPVLAAVSDVVAIGAGSANTCALAGDGTVHCWGANADGELAIATTTGPELCFGPSLQRTYPCSTVPVTATEFRLFDGARTVRWNSTDASVAAIAQNGVARGINRGLTGISASFDIVSGSTVLTVTTPQTLSLTSSGNGSGLVTGAGTYDFGTIVSVVATPSLGSQLQSWTGPDGPECATGQVVMNADKSCTAVFALLPAINTPVGTNVSVTPGSGISLTFASVTAAGQTTAITSSSGPAIPAGFQLGNPAVYFEITSTASFNGIVRVCFAYSPAQFANPAALRLLHFEGGSWTDVTLSNLNSEICGQVTGFSPFVLAQPTNSLPDLTVTSVSASKSSVSQGEGLKVSVGLANRGTIAAKGFSVSAFLVDASGGNNAAPIPVAQDWVKQLAGGASTSDILQGRVRGSVAPGRYRLCAGADVLNVVAETDEGNNVLCSKTPINVRPHSRIGENHGPRSERHWHQGHRHH